MNLIARNCRTVIAVTLILTCVAAAQVSSSTAPPPQDKVPASSSASFSMAGSADSVDRLRGALAMSAFGSASASAPVFIVPAQEITEEQLATIGEDVNVMTRILENKLRQANLMSPRTPFPLFVGKRPMSFLGGDGDQPHSLYLQGYGVLFMMSLDFPLAPGPEVDTEEPKQTETDADPVWARTREEIYQPQAHRNDTSDESRPEYSAEQVENLKATIIKALVHAANIRILGPEESVIVTVTGSGPAQNAIANTIVIPGTGQIVVDGTMGDTARTVLTIRTKVADIKALSQQKLTDEQFRQRVQILSHPLLGGATSSAIETRYRLAPGGRNAGIR